MLFSHLPTKRPSEGAVPELSLHFDRTASAKLVRDSISSAGDSKRFTISLWVKLMLGVSSSQTLVCLGDTTTSYLEVNAYNGNLLIQQYGTTFWSKAWALDEANWQHVFIKVDTTQATAANRVKVYQDGSLQTKTTGTDPTLNQDLYANLANSEERIGHRIGTAVHACVNLYDVFMLDGNTQYDVNHVGHTVDSKWVPKPLYIGEETFGVHGFRLKFEDTVTIGLDTAGNGNFTGTSIVISTDSTPDRPHYNLCIFQPNASPSQLAVAEYHNLRLTQASVAMESNIASFHMGTTGKYYFEAYIAAGNVTTYVGVASSGFNGSSGVGRDNYSWGIKHVSNYTASLCYHNNVSKTAGYNSTAADRYAVAVDVGLGRIWFKLRSVWILSGNPATNTNPTYTGVNTNIYPAGTIWDATTSGILWNLGQYPFYYTAPTGFGPVVQEITS